MPWVCPDKHYWVIVTLQNILKLGGFFCDCREPVGVWQPSPETDDTGESKGSNKQLQQKALVTYTSILQNKLHVRMHNNQCTRQISHIGELCLDNTR